MCDRAVSLHRKKHLTRYRCQSSSSRFPPARVMRRSRLIGVGLIIIGLLASVCYLTSNSENTDIPKSAIVSLVKQQDLYTVLESVRNVEDRWNQHFHHDWVFLSEQDFNDEFKSVISAFVSGDVHFRTINRKEHWRLPGNIDRNKLMNEMRDLESQGVPYAGSLTYRLMCRFQSFFFVEYLPEYRYYARIDPDVKLYCDITEDLFAQMYDGNYKLGYTIGLRELPHAFNGLSSSVNQFMKNNPELLHENQWVDSFVRPWDNGCHFWSNLEIGDLDFFRSPKYKSWFDHVENSGGIFYQRWGDAPIHTLGAALFLDINEIHWFSEVGSYHYPNVNCPTDRDERLARRCSCPHDPTLGSAERNQIFTYKQQSCIPQLLQLQGKSFQQNWQQFADSNVILEHQQA